MRLEMKETNLDSKRAYWLVKVPALKYQIREFFEMMVHNYLEQLLQLLTLSTTTEKLHYQHNSFSK